MTVIKASGGAVFRPVPGGCEVLVVHRPRYDDWTLPKGKDEPGETSEQAALREVAEETGQTTRILGSLPPTTYETPGGTKTVSWFAMKAIGSAIPFVANGEVDRISWLPIEEAVDRLTYQRDRDLIAGLDCQRLLRTGTLYLVRHAAAGDRASWEGPDLLRPLNKKGVEQAAALSRSLAGQGIESLWSSPYVRCIQTLEALAAVTGLPITSDESLGEGSGRAARRLARSLAGTNAVISSHGDVIPALLDWMVAQGMELLSPFDCKKGSTWEVAVEGGDFTRARYVPPPEV
jgi:broad specificity phosphatase PhoE/8-oxo-dGTP pyrophosphatase MutT (NUDIX family)